MALDCASITAARPNATLAAVVATDPNDRRLQAFCAKQGIEAFIATDPNESGVVDALRAIRPRFLLSVNNYRILQQPILTTATEAALNFHNGPLPRYAGLHIPAWAIWNGETRHGVTWHYIEEGIDTGAIAAQTMFDVGDDDTAATLTFRCIVEGTRVYPTLLDDLLAGRADRRRQAGERTYFGRRDVPNRGYVNPDWDHQTLTRFLRAMNFRPFPNPLGPIKLRVGTGELRFTSGTVAPLSEEARHDAAGTVLRIQANGLTIRTIDSELELQADDGDEFASVSEQCDLAGVLSGTTLGPAPST